MNRAVVVAAIFAVLTAIFGYLVYLNFFAPEPTAIPTGLGGSSGLAAPRSLPGAASSERSQQPVALFFQRRDAAELVAEERSMTLSDDANQRARGVLEALGQGSNQGHLPTLPEGTRVRQIYFDATGVAYVDFSAEFRDNHIGGSSEELITVYSVVATLAHNVPQAQAVLFLVEGRPLATLAGHVDLSQPLRPKASTVAALP